MSSASSQRSSWTSPALNDQFDWLQSGKSWPNCSVAAVDDASVATANPTQFLLAIDGAAFTNTPALAAHTFEDLRACGRLRLIRSEAVREALYN